MTGNKIVPGQGAISKNPPKTFTEYQLAEWLARLNPEYSLFSDRGDYLRIIKEAIEDGELPTIGEKINPVFNKTEKVITREAASQWCYQKEIFFGGATSQTQEADQTCKEKTVKKHSREALLSVVKAMYQDINETFIPLIDKDQLPYHLQEKIKKDCKLRPSGYGEYLTNDRGACKSAKDIVPEALKLKPEKK